MKRLLWLAVLGLLIGNAQAAPRVVVSIPPIHSLVSGVMQGMGEPVLLLKGAVSPHHFSLRPSDVRRLYQAEVLFWVGEPLESFLHRAVAGLGPQTRVVSLLDMEGLQRLPLRKGRLWEDAHDGVRGDADDPVSRYSIDPHVWLDPRNAVVLVHGIASVLAATDPAGAQQYQANATRLIGELRALDKQLGQTLEPFRSSRYLVFHDAYQYLENRYGLRPGGAISVSPEQRPGVRHLMDIRRRLRESAAVCVFSEPQFDVSLVKLVSEGMSLRHAVLDPLGMALVPGPRQYAELMNQLARNLKVCLGSVSA